MPALVAGNPLEDINAAADVRYVVKNGVSSSIEDILAPFTTPAAKQRRAEAIANHRIRCATGVASEAECLLEAHEH